MSNKLYCKLLIVLFFVNVAASQAQETRPRVVEAGFCAGPTISWATPQTDGYESSGAKIGGFYGINVDINLVRTKQLCYVSTGIIFSHLRFGLNYCDNYRFAPEDVIINNAEVTSTYRNMYLTIPTAIKLKTEYFSDFAVFGVVGLNHGFRISAKSNDKIVRPNGTEDKDDDVNQTENMALMRESVFAVLGAEYIIYKQTKAYFGLAYSYGLNNVFKNKYTNAMSLDKVKAHGHTFEFQFGFIF